QLILDFAHIVMAERKRGKVCVGLLLRGGRHLDERRTLLSRVALRGRRQGWGGLVGALRADTGRPADQQGGGCDARNRLQGRSAGRRGLARYCEHGGLPRLGNGSSCP